MKNIIVLLVLVGMFKAGECGITGWEKPSITAPAATGTLTEKINNGTKTSDTTGVTITATSDQTGGVSAYVKESQDPASPELAIHATSGDVTVTAGTVDYSLVTSFSLVVSANDAGNTASTATVTLLVNAAPSFSAYSSNPCIADGATAGTVLIDLTATDANSDSISYAIASGNTHTDFEITSTGVVKVATGKTLNMVTTNTYTLVITATDNSSSPLVTSATVTATVSTTCSATKDDPSTTTVAATVSSTGSGAAALAVTFMTVLSALIVPLQ